jgi:hypothetical protein
MFVHPWTKGLDNNVTEMSLILSETSEDMPTHLRSCTCEGDKGQAGYQETRP